MVATTDTIIAPSTADKLSARLQDKKWHTLDEFAPDVGTISELRTALLALRKLGYVIESKQIDKSSRALKHRFQSTSEFINHPCDVVDIAVLAQLYKYAKRKKRVQVGRIYLDICHKVIIEEPQILYSKMQQLSKWRYVVGVRQRNTADKLCYFWKILPKGQKLIERLANSENNE